MATVEKIRKDIEKTKEKISAQQKRLRELEAQLTEEENLEIVRMVKAVRMDNKELTAFLKAYASGLITLPDGMMEAEAAPDPDDEDMEGMEDIQPFQKISKVLNRNRMKKIAAVLVLVVVCAVFGTLTVGQIFRNTSLLLLAPIVTALVALTGSWRLLLPIYAGLTVLGGIWLQFTTVAEPERSGHAAGMSDCFRLLRNRAVLLCTLGVACFIAGDVGIGFLSVRLIDNPDSILTTTGFYACRFVVTLVGAWVLVRLSDVKYLSWNMAGALVLCVVLLFVRNEAAIYAAVGLMGFAMACVFATFYAVATKAVPEQANGVAGLMIMAIAAGAVSGPVCGAIIRWTGNPHLGMLFVALCVGYMLWASIKLKIK